MSLVGLKCRPPYLHHFSYCDYVIRVEPLCDGFISTRAYVLM